MKNRYYDKIKACIESCVTHGQLTTCTRLIRIFIERFTDYTMMLSLYDIKHAKRLEIIKNDKKSV